MSLARQGFLQLRLDAALGRLAAMETLLDAERLHARQAQAALAVAERALDRHRETMVVADEQRQHAAADLGRMKQALHEAALEKARQAHQIATLGAALASRVAEIEQLKGAGAAVEAELRAARTKHGCASDALQGECLRLEENLQSERRDKFLLERALDLARANRRALHEYLHLQSAAGRPLDARIAQHRPSAIVVISSAVAPNLPAQPRPQPLEQDAPLPPPCPALTEHLHAACN
ncbi:hypothetical protein IP69_20205 [Bosea sp. AAP35]|nr:hypothetical protein IP69_20205 [Bosea sp. AAP35]